MSLAYANFYKRISSVFESANSLVKESNFPMNDEIHEKLETGFKNFSDKRSLRFVLIGEFSAGKSSIISALTGQELAIESDVTTPDIQEFKWNGITLVDTPGIQSEIETQNKISEHDKISKDATIGADLVLFVVTNELFNQRLANHLNYIIYELALADKTAIVVNKIDREVNPPDVLFGEIVKILEENENIPPIYICSASKYLDSLTQKGDLKVRFREQSLFDEFIEEINDFVKETGENGKLSTPIVIVEDCLNKIEKIISKDSEERFLRGNIQQQRNIVKKLQLRIDEIKNSKKQRLISIYVNEANDCVEKLTELSTDKDMNFLVEEGLKKIDAEVKQTLENLETELKKNINEAVEEIKQYGETILDKELGSIDKSDEKNTEFKFEKVNLKKSKFSKFARKLEEPLKQLLVEAGKNTKTVRNLYYNTLKKTANYTFKPHEAMNVAKNISSFSNKFNRALPFVSVFADSFLNYLDEKDKEKKEQALAKSRLALRKAFMEHSDTKEKALEKSVFEFCGKLIQECLEDLKSQDFEVTKKFNKNASLHQKISEIRTECDKLRSDIFSG